METWMKNGAMVVFEGQVGTLRFRKSSRYTETAVDFVPVPVFVRISPISSWIGV